MMRRFLAISSALLLLAGCASTPSATEASQSPASNDGTVVFAAASLHAAFEELAEGSNVSFSFDGSSGLVDQIAGGAPADVFASADKRNMDKAVEKELIDGEPKMFATNTLVLVTPADNPAGVTGLDDSLDGAKLVVCAADVPCGGATNRLAETVGVSLKPVSEETSVTNVLGKVTAGEADAGLVYATDATGAGDKVYTIEIPEAKNDPNTYWIAAVRGGDSVKARAFIEQVTGDGQKTLSDYGFGPPAP
nr:molybdate ABC transporter substrate-binding protein [Tessaracoccus timonensis]